jgi:UDP-glucose 4-epimerase
MKNKILVTDGLGYIGSHTVVALLRANYEPIIVDNLDNSRIGILDQIASIAGVRPQFHYIDLCNEGQLLQLLDTDKSIGSVTLIKSISGIRVL